MERYANRLELSDRRIAELLPILEVGDILIIMADHGNDPTIGHSNHTRERVPLLIYSPGINGKFVGNRETMADVAASAAEYFKVNSPQHGHSFLNKILVGFKDE